jgi:Tol biopolymer transport system component
MRRWGVGRGAFDVAGMGLLVLGLIAGFVSVADAAFPGRDGRIAFVWNANTRVAPQSCADIFSIQPNGSDRRRLTRGCPWQYSDPAYSATGKQIVFVRSHEPFPRDHRGLGIYVMRADGSHVRRITASPNDADPSFSPDGRWIVFDRYLMRSHTTQIFLASVDGSHVRQLTHRKRGAGGPTFSANGREIAFVAGSGYSIDTMRPDGSHIRQLAHVRQGFGFYTDPDFSPNGRWIIFVCGVAPGLGSTAQVCEMRADGTHLEHLTPAGRTGPVVAHAAFSPDGRRIALVAFKNESAFVYTMARDGSHVHRLYDLGPHQDGTSSLGVTWQPLR